MDYQDVLDRLYELQLKVGGVRVAKVIPDSLPDHELPLFVTFESDTTYADSGLGEEAVMEVTTFTMGLFVDSATNGTAHQRQQKARAFIPRIRRVFAARPGIELLGSDVIAYDAEYLGFRGPVEMPYPANSQNYFIALLPRIRISQLLPVNYDLF